MRRMSRLCSARPLLAAVATIVLATLCIAQASAGPPYLTDDPVPTDTRNWEIYTGLTYDIEANPNAQSVGTLAQFAEFNYGALPNVQVSVSAERDVHSQSGAGSMPTWQTTFGVKTRFISETDTRPQVAFYPSISSATDDHATTLELPLWMQKSRGPWTVFGGGGVAIERGPDAPTGTFFGAALNRDLSVGTSLGIEVFHEQLLTYARESNTITNVGVIGQLGATHALVASFGRSVGAGTPLNAYAAYEFMLGPKASADR